MASNTCILHSNRRLIKRKAQTVCCLAAALLILTAVSSKAQSMRVAKHDTLTGKSLPRQYRQKDFPDLIIELFRLRTKHSQDSVPKPGKLLWAVFPVAGYALQSGGVAILASNISWYSAEGANLSNITFNPEYSFMKQTILPFTSSIWTAGNEFNFLGDWRFYKYPSYTYGLGSHTLLNKVDTIDYSFFKFDQEALMKVAHNLYGGFGYNLDYHWNIEDYSEMTDFISYNNNQEKTVSSGLIAHLKYDNRENINNPVSAFYGSIIYRWNSTLLGSDDNWQYIQVEMRKYIKLNGRGTTKLAFWSWNEFTFGGKPPYLDLPSTGWDTYSNTGRGYIQGRFRGNNMLYLETELRFNILKNGLLGGVVFSNAETTPQSMNTFGNSIISPGEGVGIRLKLNKYSGSNLCIDYAFGTQGSRGFFFNIGEVF